MPEYIEREEYCEKHCRCSNGTYAREQGGHQCRLVVR
nr:MAG TPA: Potassium channel toxin kappa-KTX3.1/ALPHA MOTIF, ALPHA SCORPION TOXIN [Caudoviricetes sp.]